MALELDLHGYLQLGALRRDFDRWLQDEGLAEQYIIWLRFGEGFVEADCVVQPPRAENEKIVQERRTLPVSTPPPVLVLQAIGRRHNDGGKCK